MGWKKAYWNGLETKARKVTGVVKEWKEGDPEQAWWRSISGQQVNAVEICLDGVNYGGDHSFMFEGEVEIEAFPAFGIEGGLKTFDPWYKVTEGYGSPRLAHCDVPLIESTVKEREA